MSIYGAFESLSCRLQVEGTLERPSHILCRAIIHARLAVRDKRNLRYW